jgi:predicted Zn-dependent protease
MLAESEKDFSRDYNPPARLARAYFEMTRLDEAARAIDRALALAYGPRKMRLYALKADILSAKGDSTGAHAAIAEALKLAGSLPLTGGYARLKGELEKRLGGP